YFRFSTLKVLQNVLRRLKPVVTALIAIAAVSLLQSAFLTPDFNVMNAFVFVGAFIILRFTKLDPTLIIFLSGAIGLIAILI
ncbi:MAG TPA: chromate transporter, partial [Erysipelothrix sp.]|nr:chromate transporter [Erysipelothrix sp.]